jgi:hypothetical protein
MKKTVTLTTLIKAKSDLELYIKIDQISRLKKLFLPNFDLNELNSSIEAKENQLINIKLGIDEGNSTKDEKGVSVRYYIYLLSKYNRFKSDMLGLCRKLNNDDWLSQLEETKESLLNEINELNCQIDKETDKKKKTDLMSTKTKVKRSLSKLSTKSRSHTTDLKKLIDDDLKDVEVKIEDVKAILKSLNDKITVEVEIADEFKMIG